MPRYLFVRTIVRFFVGNVAQKFIMFWKNKADFSIKWLQEKYKRLYMPLLNQKYDFAGMFLLYIRYAKDVYI